MIVMMGRTFPSGLTIYWFLGQVIQIFFNLRMKKLREEITGSGKKGGRRKR